MKMREVCARTGLTDRTVRYWTEQGLLNPFREGTVEKATGHVIEEIRERYGE